MGCAHFNIPKISTSKANTCSIHTRMAKCSQQFHAFHKISGADGAHQDRAQKKAIPEGTNNTHIWFKVRGRAGQGLGGFTVLQHRTLQTREIEASGLFLGLWAEHGLEGIPGGYARAGGGKAADVPVVSVDTRVLAC
jgi:hypothetical protein